MNILLSGYTGFLGEHIANVLEKENYHVRILMNRTTKPKNKIIKGAEVIWGSITDTEVIAEAVKGVHAVIHSAWSFSDSLSSRPTVNEIGAKILFTESLKSNVDKFAFISSVAVYGMEKKSIEPIEEDQALDEKKLKEYIYPSEKYNVEQFLKNSGDNKIKIGIFRPGPIFDDKRPPIKKIVKIKGRNIGIGMGNGKNTMPNIHAEDVAAAVGLWIKNSDKSGIYNVTPTHSRHVSEWYANWGKKINQTMYPIFIPVSFFRFANFGVNILKKLLKKNKGDINYAIVCATRNMVYSNNALKADLNWFDNKTIEYTNIG